VTPPVFVVPTVDLSAATAGSVVRLADAEGRHAVAVRRMTAGEPITLVDGHGRRASGSVLEVIGKQALDVMVAEVGDEPAPVPRIVVVQALPKGDRGALAVELLTEVGVDAIVPWAAANCVTRWSAERSDRGHRRWADAAHAAAKQARRPLFPVIEPLASTTVAVERAGRSALALVLHEGAAEPIGAVDPPAEGEVIIVVGPEGGLTRDELAAFAAAGARAVRLGPSVLRTSSAGIAAVSILLARTSRWRPSPVEG